MKMKNKIAALTILTAFNFSAVAQAASIDEELAVIAAEQEEVFSNENKSAQENIPQQKKSRKELREEEKRLRREKKAEEKRIKEEMKSAEKEFKEAQEKSKDQDKNKLKISERDSSQKNFPKVDPVAPKAESVELEEKKFEPEVVTFTPTPATQSPATPTPATQTPATPTPAAQTPATPTPAAPTPAAPTPATPTPAAPVSLPNPVVMFSNFEELTNSVHFTPLYIPKKSGFSIDSMLAIDGNVAEIRYGRRWEPEVTLRVRTYKRTAGEELKDISGVYGVKWRVDMSAGTSVYIAKIEENKHVAAWAVGDYTFSAQVENLSFAAFHAIVIEELVDLSSHYYVK